MDKKILSALLKGEDMTMYQKLFLAMVWDRVDIAEEKILATGMYSIAYKTNYCCYRKKFNSTKYLIKNILFPYLEANMNGLAEAADEIMFQAIVFERINFINLLISSGRFVLRDFLTPAKLQKLYNESVRLKSTIRIFTNTTCLLTIEVSTNIKIASAFP